ncbi:competence protein ComEC [Fontimonas thermophila]|uniref:Competence protein ComEC n=1 Tax=Fontimonas thermophila TaxID=1076937 RepID=A0A1I2IH67_9GAMM|nr:DNA internalization-related competence protein ComEC/Rec2 [Fontimonas thermophila]SFF39881.1 competence protein ComEC [Fontimonas thermophila]
MDAAVAGHCRRAHEPVDVRLLVLALSAGVLAVLMLPRLPPAAVLAALALPALWPWRGRSLWGAFALGVLVCSWQGQRYLDARWPADRHGEILWVDGTIASLPERRPTAESGRSDWRFVFAPHSSALPRRLRVSWYQSDEIVMAGECWRLQLKLRAVHGSLNPGGFDYEGWLLRDGIGALATVREAHRCEDGDRGHWILRLRQRIVDRLRAELGDTRAAALAAALTVGDTSGLRDADWRTFRVTGTTHLIAISGFNLAIVAGFAFFLLRWGWSLWPRLCLALPAQRFALAGSGVVAVGYALLAGFEAPVTRALIMLLVLIASAAVHRLHEPTRALAYAWGLILLFDPFAALSPGLWLSFAAVTAIFYVSLGRLRAERPWLLALRVQLFLALALIPLGLYFFHGLTWLAPFVNLIAVPLVSVLTPLLLIAQLGFAVHEAAAPVLHAVGWVLEQGYQMLAWCVAHAPAAWIPASPPLPALLLGLFGAVLVFLPRGVPLRALAVPCLAALALPRNVPVPGGLELTALDVGQGSAIVVRTRSHTLLFDAGPAYEEGFDAGRSVVAPYLLKQGIRRLDLLIVSHGDNDHAGGVSAVRELLDVRAEIGSETGKPCMDGQSWDWDGVHLQLLHPDGRPWSDNDRSCVLRIDGPFSILLPGDIERRAERRLLDMHRPRLRADVLLSPHHGSRSSSGADFVSAVQPQIVVHTAGWRNRFGHPRAEVVARYAAIGAAQYITGVEGAVHIGRDASGRLRVVTWRQRAARWWNAPAAP